MSPHESLRAIIETADRLHDRYSAEQLADCAKLFANIRGALETTEKLFLTPPAGWNEVDTSTEETAPPLYMAYIITGIAAPRETFYLSSKELNRLIGDCRDHIEQNPTHAPIYIRNGATREIVVRITDRNTVHHDA